MKKNLKICQKKGLLKSIDIIFAQKISLNEHPILMLLSAILSSDVRKGHICLPLNLFNKLFLFNGLYPNLAKQIWKSAGNLSLNKLKKILNCSSIISDGTYQTPLVLKYNRIYFHRMWKYESIIFNFFNKPIQYYYINYKNIKRLINYYFIDKNKNIINWQKIAILIAITRNISIIYGGPGTGKTYIISKIISILIKIKMNKNLIIKIASPTGRSAIKLKESIFSFNDKLLNKNEKKIIPKNVTTIHKLLGIKNDTDVFYNKNNPLKIDILIIDEFSMINLNIMIKLINALEKNTHIIFFGDNYQLPSIQSGSCLNEICKLNRLGYSFKRVNEINKFYKINISNNLNIKNILKNRVYYNNYLDKYFIYYKHNIKKYFISNIINSICKLKQNYRFSKLSEIGKLSIYIKNGNINKTLNFLKSNNLNNIKYYNIYNKKSYKLMINHCFNLFNQYIKNIKNNNSIKSIIKIFNTFKIICCTNNGPYGVLNINYYIEKKIKLLKYYKKYINKKYYPGCPIIILENSYLLNIYNGDIGIVLLDHNKNMFVYFLLSNNKINKISINILPKHNIAFAITVHKSQGSEFLNTILILPNNTLPMLNRKLLYTAITRSKKLLTIYGKDKIISFIINNNIQIRSGIIHRLLSMN